MRPTVGRILQVFHLSEWKAALVVACPTDATFITRVFDQYCAQESSGMGALHDFNLRLALHDEGKTWRWPPREG